MTVSFVKTFVVKVVTLALGADKPANPAGALAFLALR